MKYLFVFLILLNNSFAAEFTNSWNDEFEKIVTMTCSEGDTRCESFCDITSKCEIKETVCRDCIGTSVNMTYVFNYLGLNLVNSGEEVTTYEVTDFLNNGEFVTINSKSIYNHVDSFNSLALRRKFRSLCENGAREPLVFFDTDPKSGKIGKVRFVACDEKFFIMEDNPDIILDESSDTLM